MANQTIEDIKKLAPKEDFTWLETLWNALEKKQDTEDDKLAFKILSEEIPVLIKARYSSSIDSENIGKILDIAKIGLTVIAK